MRVSRFHRTTRPTHQFGRGRFALVVCLLLTAVIPLATSAEGDAGGSGAIGAIDLLEPVKESLSGSSWMMAEGLDPRLWGGTAQRDRYGVLDWDTALAPAPNDRSGNLSSYAPQVPFRSPGPAFSRNLLITRQLGLFPIQTEPSIAVDPFDPDHLVMGAIDYNFPSMSSYTSFDGGETWDGPNQVRYFSEDVTAAGDPVVSFDREGNVYIASISLGFQEFIIGSLVSFTEVSSMVVSKSTDAGLTWSDAVSAARSEVQTTSNVDPDGRERGEIISAFLDKPWMAIGPNPEDPELDIIYLSYTEFATTFRVIYADELPFLTSPATETTIRTVRSTDGGRTWSDPIGVSPTVLQAEGAGEEDEGGFSQFATAGPDGNAAGVGTQEEQGVAFAEANRTVQGSQPAVLSDGSVVVTYVDTTNDGVQEGLATIMVAKSTDGGLTWADPVQAGMVREPHFRPRTSSFRYWGTVFPQIGAGPDNEIYILVSALPPDKSIDDGDIYLMRSLDGGTTWAEPVRLNGDDTSRLQFYPSIDVAPDGSVHAMWGDMRDDPDEVRYHIYYSRSDDRGETWGFVSEELGFSAPDIRVTDFPSNSLRGFPGGRFIGDYFSLTATDEDVYMVWADTRLGEFGSANQQIGFARQSAITPPSLFLNPPSGTAGRDVTIQGLGFQPRSNVAITVGGVLTSNERTNEDGAFTTNIYMPVTGEGARDVSAFDETGNVATASFYTEFGFDSIQESIQGLQEQIAASEGGATPGAESLPPPPAAVASPMASPQPATPAASSAEPVSVVSPVRSVSSLAFGGLSGLLLFSSACFAINRRQRNHS